jgi:hypothetical protein
MAIYSNRIVISISKTGAGPWLNIANSQSIPTQTGLQVMWQVSVSTLQARLAQLNINLNSNLSNLRFVYNGQFVPAWLESINNDIATIWIKMPVSIPANSSITLNLYADSNLNFDGAYWGEAPQLSPTYGQYDNGTAVFNNYWNFAGTSTPSGWIQSGCSVSYNNGVLIVSSATGTYWYYTNAIYSGDILVEEMMEVIAQTSTNQGGEGGVGITTTSPSFYSTFSMTRVVQGAKPTIASIFGGNRYYFSSIFEPVGTFGIIGFYASSSGMAVYSNYQTIATSTKTVPSSYYIVGANLSTGAQVFVQWLRTRAYPPNGVMPTVELM